MYDFTFLNLHSSSLISDSPSSYIWRDECTSTQDLFWHYNSSFSHTFSRPLKGVATSVQNQGRGRQGKTWITPPHHALALSWTPSNPSSFPLEWIPLFPFLSAITLTSCLMDWGVPKELIHIKWPNDIMILSSSSSPSFLKVAGILCEGRQNHHHLQILIGIGINLFSHSQLHFSKPIISTALDQWSPQLQESRGSPSFQSQIPHLAIHLFSSLEKTWLEYKSLPLTDAKSKVFKVWKHFELPQGTPLSSTVYQGTYQGINQEGELLILDSQSHLIRTVSSGEVQLIDHQIDNLT